MTTNDTTAPDLRSKSLEWFFALNETEKLDLKERHLPNTPIVYDEQWGFNFTFGQIEEMYKKIKDEEQKGHQRTG